MQCHVRALALLILATAAASTARAAVLEESSVGGWIVGAYSGSKTGQFSHCATSVPYRSGISLLFHLDKDYRWTMGLANPQWRHAAGQTFSLAYFIDGGPSIPARAVVLHTGMITIPLADSQALFEAFRRGQRLHIQDAQETFTFNLTNSAQALAATLACVQRYAGRAPSSSPLSAPRASVQDGELRAEAAILAANLLSGSGIKGFRLLPRDRMPTETQRFHAVWAAEGGLVGMVTIVPPKGNSAIDDVVAGLTAMDSKECKGAFSSGRYPTEDSGVGRLVTLCQGSDYPEMQYTVARRRAGGFYILSVTGRGITSGDVLEAGTRLYDVAQRTLTAGPPTGR
jgi:hypothetical protein